VIDTVHAIDNAGEVVSDEVKLCEADVTLDVAKSLHGPGAQVIHHPYGATSLNEAPDQMRADEARTAGHEVDRHPSGRSELLAQVLRSGETRPPREGEICVSRIVFAATFEYIVASEEQMTKCVTRDAET
jgi:hypothetical protein